MLRTAASQLTREGWRGAERRGTSVHVSVCMCVWASSEHLHAVDDYAGEALLTPQSALLMQRVDRWWVRQASLSLEHPSSVHPHYSPSLGSKGSVSVRIRGCESSGKGYQGSVTWKRRGRDWERETHLARRGSDDADTPSSASLIHAERACHSDPSLCMCQKILRSGREPEVENEMERDKYKSRKCSNEGFHLGMFHANNIPLGQSVTS